MTRGRYSTDSAAHDMYVTETLGDHWGNVPTRLTPVCPLHYTGWTEAIIHRLTPKVRPGTLVDGPRTPKGREEDVCVYAERVL